MSVNFKTATLLTAFLFQVIILFVRTATANELNTPQKIPVELVLPSPATQPQPSYPTPTPCIGLTSQVHSKKFESCQVIPFGSLKIVILRLDSKRLRLHNNVDLKNLGSKSSHRSHWIWRDSNHCATSASDHDG